MKHIKKPSSFKRCWETHPVYKIGGEFPVIGGSCTTIYPDVDIFVGLDWGSKTGKRSYPWNKGEDIFFTIPDMGVPPSVAEFKKLINYLSNQLKMGKSVFIGCIGGHGRTGLVLAALTTYMTGDKDSITTVRADYCKKAVESSKQVAWLKKNFGIKTVKGAKEGNSVVNLTPPHDLFGLGQQDMHLGGSEPQSLDTEVTNLDNPIKFYCVKADTIWITLDKLN